MNHHALSPRRYKQSVVAGFVHRIHRACSTWNNFHESLLKAKCILERNQYPPDFYEPIIKKAIDKILNADDTLNDNEKDNSNEKQNGDESSDAEAQEPIRKKLVFFEYRGKVTDDYCRALKKIDAPCQPVLTLQKLKTVLPSLKPAVDKPVRSHTVYQITCPRCNSCYIGATTRCLLVRFREHLKPSQPVGKHARNCNVLDQMMIKNVKILASTTRSEVYLFTLEALWQKEERPKINTKDEYKRHELTVMW